MKKPEYCSFCGKKLTWKTLSDGSKERYCLKCDHVFFETPSAAVIVLVTNANRVLLARAIEWKHPYWGLISGHIKLGETAEQAATREVNEEVGLSIRNLRILRSFIKDDELLMIAFKAETKNLAIKKSPELEVAKWFDPRQPLPMRPAAISAQAISHVFPEATFKKTEN